MLLLSLGLVIEPTKRPDVKYLQLATPDMSQLLCRFRLAFDTLRDRSQETNHVVMLKAPLISTRMKGVSTLSIISRVLTKLSS